MPMPEAAMYEDDLTVPREDDVRPTWKVPDMEPKSVAQGVKQLSDHVFRLCVTPANP